MYDIKKLHKVHLEIANEIHRVCVKNNIHYSLIGGTLLGAVRHRGFIPWDDDFDLGMTRYNYDLFLRAITEDMSSKYEIISMHEDDLYSVPFLKIVKKHTLLRESALPKKMEGYGIFVDVFPYDNVPNSKIKRLYHKINTDIYFRLLLAKSNYNLDLEKYSIKKLIYIFFQAFASLVPRNFLVARLEKNSIRYNDEKTDFLTTIGGPYGYTKEMVPKNLFESLKLFDYENSFFFAFENYDENLRYLYGDYMKFPPIDERFNRHSYEFVDFGD